MSKCRLVVRSLCAVVLLVVLAPCTVAIAADKDKNTVSGIVTDKGTDSLTVRADGEEEPVKYAFTKKQALAVKGIYVVGRVRLTYKMDGDNRQLVSVKQYPGKASGVVTGEVLHTHDWWVEVKPKSGVPEGFAAKIPFEKNKPVMDQLKSLEKGDMVRIQYITDSERHRIVVMRKLPKKKD